MSNPVPRIDVWNDISEQFEFLDEQLIYVDEPLEGLLRAKTGELFAFRCTAIIADCLWHWVLLPVQSTAVSVKESFEVAQAKPPSEWGSVVEDRRGEQPRVSVAWLKGGIHEIPKNVLDA
jgi:hypothetical protein